MSAPAQLVLLAGAWLLYGVIHSLLASHACKAWVRSRYPDRFKAYRLAFNLVSTILLLPPLALLFSYPGAPLWRWTGAYGWLADAAAIAAIAGLFATFRIYDTGEFLGTRQLRKGYAALDDQAPMSLSWAHRFVRHPWYFLGLVIIWTRDMNAALLVTAVMLTLYIVVGSRLEEQKLTSLYGEQYRSYTKRVPGLIPLPWRFLSRAESARLAGMRAGAAQQPPAQGKG